MSSIGIGMIGGGTVGGGVYAALSKNGELVRNRTCISLEFKKIAVKAFDEPRAVDIPLSLLTTDWHEVVNAPDIQIVIELMGGTGLAKEIILSALRLGKAVVTANKALLSACGQELFQVAAENHTCLYYEASVAGGVPLLRSVKEAFVCNHFPRITGIVNGTCNYILSEMQAQGRGFEEVLAEAQKSGYAEANPGLDVDGHDAHQKITILASLAHNAWVNTQSVYREGIRSVTQMDIQLCKELGYRIKLLGSIDVVPSPEDQKLEAGVAPTLVPKTHLLSKVKGVFNGIWVTGDVVGDTFFYGRGAGAAATASAVVGDITDAAINILNGTPERLPAMSFCSQVQMVPVEEVEKCFYVRVVAEDAAESRLEDILRKNEVELSIVKSVKIESSTSDTPSLGWCCLTNKVARKVIHQVIQEFKALPQYTQEPVAFEILEV